jgi:hypothetical protein
VRKTNIRLAGTLDQSMMVQCLSSVGSTGRKLKSHVMGMVNLEKLYEDLKRQYDLTLDRRKTQ